jgi:hypothetical protein
MQKRFAFDRNWRCFSDYRSVAMELDALRITFWRPGTRRRVLWCLRRQGCHTHPLSRCGQSRPWSGSSTRQVHACSSTAAKRPELAGPGRPVTNPVCPSKSRGTVYLAFAFSIALRNVVDERAVQRWYSPRFLALQRTSSSEGDLSSVSPAGH